MWSCKKGVCDVRCDARLDVDVMDWFVMVLRLGCMLHAVLWTGRRVCIV